MLAKLMKYEVKATARWFLPLYVSVLLFALINKLTWYGPFMENKFSFTDSSINNPALSGNSFVPVIKGIMSSLFMFIYVMLFVGLFVATLIVVIQRYYKSLLGDEGYLMFTLPVNAWQHILNKLVISALWCLLSSIVGICSILILIPREALQELPYAFARVKEFIGVSGIVIFVLGAVTSLVLGILKIYSAISLGHLFNKYKLLLSFVMYLAIDAITQVVWMLITVFSVNISLNKIDFASMSNLHQVKYVFAALTVLNVVFSAGHFLLTSYLVKRRLNLE